VRWSWLSLPYLVLTALLCAIAVHTMITRGDRVMRVGVLGAVAGALPWAMCSALAVLFHDPGIARRLLRLGNGPVSLIGPSVLLLLLGASGQLERQRWVVRSAGALGFVSMIVTWTTELMIRDVQLLPSGIYYSLSGPLMAPHVGMIAIWAGIGVYIIRRAMPGHERNRALRLLVAILVLGTFGLADALLAYGIAGWYPLAWLPGILCTLIAARLIHKNDLLRRQGRDAATAMEAALLFLGGGGILLAGTFSIFGDFSDLGKALGSATLLVLSISYGRRWAGGKLANEPELTSAVSEWALMLPAQHELPAIEAEVQQLWRRRLHFATSRVLRYDNDKLVDCHGTTVLGLQAKLAAWFLRHREPLVVADLATMIVGEQRAELEVFLRQGTWDLWAPIIAREQLWGFVVANFDSLRALPDAEREFVGLTAEAVGRAGARALLLQQSLAASVHDREVELAKAVRDQADWATVTTPAKKWDVLGHKASTLRDGYCEHSWHIDGERVVVLAVEIQGAATSSALLGATALGAFAMFAAHAATLSAAELAAAVRSAVGPTVDHARMQLSIAVLSANGSDCAVAEPHAIALWPNREAPTALMLVVGGTLPTAPPAAPHLAPDLLTQAPAGCRLAVVAAHLG